MKHKFFLWICLLPSFAIAQKWISPTYALNDGDDGWVVIRNNPYDVRFYRQTATSVQIMSGTFDTTVAFTFPLQSNDGFNVLPFDVTGDGYNDVEIYDHSSHYTERIVDLVSGNDYLKLDDPSYTYELLLSDNIYRPDMDNDGHIDLIFRRSPYPGVAPYYRQLLVYQTNGLATSVANQLSTQPKSINLQQNYPNPFNPETKIRFEVPTPSSVNINIYDINGRIVRGFDLAFQPAGTHEVYWDGKNNNGVSVATGTYFYTLNMNGQSFTKKMLLLR